MKIGMVGKVGEFGLMPNPNKLILHILGQLTAVALPYKDFGCVGVNGMTVQGV
jgi:hypothetical protein